MSEGEQPVVYHNEPSSNVGRWILLVLAVAYVAASAFFIYNHQHRLDNVTQEETTNQKQIGDLTKRLQTAEADAETLAHQLGMTKKEMAARSAELSAVTSSARPRWLERKSRNPRAAAGFFESLITAAG